MSVMVVFVLRWWVGISTLDAYESMLALLVCAHRSAQQSSLVFVSPWESVCNETPGVALIVGSPPPSIFHPPYIYIYIFILPSLPPPPVGQSEERSDGGSSVSGAGAGPGEFTVLGESHTIKRVIFSFHHKNATWYVLEDAHTQTRHTFPRKARSRTAGSWFKHF